MAELETPPAIVPERDTLKSHMQAKWALPAYTEDDGAPAPAAKPALEPPPEPARPAVVEPAKPAAAAPADEPKWPRNAKEWDSYKAAEKKRTEEAQTQAATYKSDVDKLTKEIEALKKSGPSPELETVRQELESVKKEREDYQKRLQTVAVEKDPRFEKYFNTKTTQQIDLAKSIVGVANADAVAKVLSLPEGEYRDAKVEELMSTLSPLQANRLGGVLNNLTSINQERSAALTEAQTIYEQIQSQTKATREAQSKQMETERTKAFDTVLSEAVTANEFFKKGEDVTTNQTVDQRIATAKSLMFENKPHADIAKAAMYAAAFPASLRRIEALSTENTQLKEQITKLSAAGPKLEPGQARPAADAGLPSRPKVNPGMSPMAASRAWMETTTGGA